MNSLALLCNLHGEGPKTLGQLRRAGCDSLDELLDRSVDELRADLEESEAFVHRFLREARHLMARMEGQGAGPAIVEPTDASGGGEPSALTWGHDRAADSGAPTGASTEAPLDTRDDPSASPELTNGPMHESLQPVLATWRALDQSSPPPGLSEPQGEDEGGTRGGREPLATAGEDPGAPERIDLEDAGLPGLSTCLAERFYELGIGSLQDLVDAHPLELSRGMSLSYTRVKRFQFLAERVLADQQAQTITPRGPHSPGPEPGLRGDVSGESGGGQDASGTAAEDGPDWVESAGPFA